MNDPIAIFKKLHKSPNFMTPRLVKYGVVNDYVYEISVGTGLSGETIYGFTVANYVKRKPCSDLSQMCESEAEYEKCIDALAERVVPA